MRRTILTLAAVFIAGTAYAGKFEFNRDIRPILADNCFACHGPDEKTREAGLHLDIQAIATTELDSGEIAVVPGKPDESELVARIFSEDEDLRMPPADSNKSLTKAEKDLLRAWIQRGAEFETHWAYEVPVRATPAKDKRAKNEIDQFILAVLKEKELIPVKEADRVTLARRLSFDLIGLPPTPEEVNAFVNDKRSDAYERYVAHLLKSPHFGERMAIYWLDVVRYADSNGYHSDEPRQIAPYRDYVIDAFNNNKPYDQFLIEQLAGDLLPEATTEHKIASGFNMLLQTTNEGGAQAKEYLAKYSADRVRNTSAIFLGSTMGCAECHDHKFDPFSTKDFYSFAAFFADIQEAGKGNPPAFPVATSAHTAKLKALDDQIAAKRQQLLSSNPKIIAAQEKWEDSVADIAKQSIEFGNWWKIGPFTAGSFDEAHNKAFPPETDVDLAKQYDKLKWQEQKGLADGAIHTLSGDNSATYLYRTAKASASSPLELSLGSDDSIKVWINGSLAYENNVQRAVAANQDKATVQLDAGENEILLKIANGAGGYGFYFKAGKSGLPNNIIAILKTPRDRRNDQQRAELAKYYGGIAPQLKSVRDEIAKLEAQKKTFNAQLPKTLMTRSGNPRTIRVLARGNWMDDSGEVVQPRVPEFLKPLEVGDRRATRLDLAKWMVDQDNPLTARTFVNRLWKLFYGNGLAYPLDDFGRQGSLPTHPELLDWLAVEFMESGWDVKHMVQLMVTSATYRQESRASAELLKIDPKNQWYARQSRFRLEAEMVRDNALAVSGLLVTEIGGRSVKPYQPAGYWRHMNFPKRSWQQDSGESLYRRGLYTWWQRMFLHPSMLAFDAPSREECTVERPRSNTPLQALVLLNDPTYVEAARVFAERIIKEGGGDLDARLDFAFRQTLSRTIHANEREVLKNLFDKHHADYAADNESAKQLLGVGAMPMTDNKDVAELAAWTSVARVVLNLHETITRR